MGKVDGQYIDCTYKAIVGGRCMGMIDENPSTALEIENYCANIVNTLEETGLQYIPQSQFKPYLKLYWKKGLGNIHKEMRL